jgi:co-chaperonin GroES (HSP10)
MSKLGKLIVVGDRVLIKPDEDKEKTNTGLYLPPTVTEKEKVQGGYVVKIGPGYPVPNLNAIDEEIWAEPKKEIKYIPLQAEEGDYALFLRKSAIEIEFEGQKYLIVPQSAILVLMRDRFLDY